MKEDPIVAEVHAIRRRMMEECDNDPKKFYAMLKRAEAKYSERLVRRDTKPLRKAAKRTARSR